MNVLDNCSASLVPLALAAVVFFWKAHRWRHPARTYWSACLILPPSDNGFLRPSAR